MSGPTPKSLRAVGLTWYAEDSGTGRDWSNVPKRCSGLYGDDRLDDACFEAITGFPPSATGLTDKQQRKVIQRLRDWHVDYTLGLVPIIGDIVKPIVHTVTDTSDVVADTYEFLTDPMTLLAIGGVIVGGGLLMLGGIRTMTAGG